MASKLGDVFSLLFGHNMTECFAELVCQGVGAVIFQTRDHKKFETLELFCLLAKMAENVCVCVCVCGGGGGGGV